MPVGGQRRAPRRATRRAIADRHDHDAPPPASRSVAARSGSPAVLSRTFQATWRTAEMATRPMMNGLTSGRYPPRSRHVRPFPAAAQRRPSTRAARAERQPEAVCPRSAASARSLRTRRCASTRLASDARPSRTRIPVQRSNGSKVAPWMTRVPPATGSSRQLHSLSNPDAVTRSRKRALGPRLEALDPGRVAQQPEPGPRRARRRGRRPGRRGRPELELREERGRRRRVVERRPHDPRRGMDEDPPLDRAASVSASGRRDRRRDVRLRCRRHGQPPIGCQTVFISRKAAIHSGRSAAASSSQSKRASATRGRPARAGA